MGKPSLWSAHAQEIQCSSLSKRGVQGKDIIERSLRLDCMLPCIDTAIASGPRSKGFLLQSGLLEELLE